METTNNKITGSENVLNSNQLWSRYIAYWPLYLLLAALFLTLTWTYLKTRVPEYEITASVLIKDEKKGIVSQQKNGENLNQVVTTKLVDNEIEVIQARSILDEAVKNLFLYAPVSEKKNYTSISSYSTSPVKIELKDPFSIAYATEAEKEKFKKVYFTYDTKTAKVKIENKEYPLKDWLSTEYGTLRFLPGHIANDTLTHKYFFSLVDPKLITANIHDKLKLTTPSKPSTIIDVSYKDQDIKRGEDIVNEIIKLYQNSDFEDKNSLAKNTLQFVEYRLKSVSHDLDSIENKIQFYKRNQEAVDIPAQGELYLQNVSTNNQRLAELNSQQAVLDRVQNSIESKNSYGGIVPSALGVQDDYLSQMLNNLNEKELQYADLKKTVAENNPILTSLNDQIQTLKSSVTENIQNQRKNLASTKSSLNATNNSYASSLQSIPQKERDLVEISRQQDMLNKIYSYLLQQREESALTYESTVATNRLIDRAQSSAVPMGPKPIILYLAAVASGLILGIAIITMRETFSSKVLYRREIEKATSFPVIGEIAYKNEKELIIIENKKNAAIIEQFRKLRLSLNYLHVNNKRKKVLITSSISGEGKSFISKNLAVSLAQTGKKVILLECDISFPTLSSDIDINDEPGITNFLSGECSVEQIIKRTPVNDNLYIAPSGTFVTNFSEILMNGRAQELFSLLEGMFDYIIVDTAPVETATDAYVLSEYCDATLYVVRQKYTPKFFVQRLDENSKINPLKNMAIIFNGVHARKFGNSNYGFGYGYAYFDETKNKRLSNKRAQDRKLINYSDIKS